MRKYLARLYRGNLYTVIHAGGFVCLQENRAACLAKLAALGVANDEASAILGQDPKPSEWHSMFLQASAAEATAATAALESVASIEDVAAVREKQSELVGAVATLQQDIAADRLQQERRELEVYLDSQAQLCRDALKARGQRNTRTSEDFIWEQLWQTSAGKRLTELRYNA